MKQTNHHLTQNTAFSNGVPAYAQTISFTPTVAQPSLSFPTHAMPGLLGEMARDLVVSGIDPTIVGLQLVAFASLLTQGVADVLWPNGQRSPIGVGVLAVAPSGGGKSVIFKTLMKPMSDTLEKINPDLAGQHHPEFLIEDATREAVILHLSDWPVAGLFTDEGGQLKNLLGNGAATLAKLYDGTPLYNTRVSTGRVALVDRRLAVLLLVQPQVFEANKAKLGAGVGGVGLPNRWLIGRANDTPIGGSIHGIKLSDSAAHAYSEKVAALLKRTIALVAEKKQRPTLTLSQAATQFFVQIRDQVQQVAVTYPSPNDISEYVSRHSERVLRLAGALHAFEHGIDTEIQLTTVQAADRIGRACINSFDELTFQPPKLSQAEADALCAERLIQHAVATTGSGSFDLKRLRRNAVNVGLTPARFDRAIPVLAMQNKVRVVPNGRTDWLHAAPYFRSLGY